MRAHERRLSHAHLSRDVSLDLLRRLLEGQPGEPQVLEGIGMRDHHRPIVLPMHVSGRVLVEALQAPGNQDVVAGYRGQILDDRTTRLLAQSYVRNPHAA